MKIWLLGSDLERHDSFTYVDFKTANSAISKLRLRPTEVGKSWTPLKIKTIEKRGGHSSYHPELLLPAIDQEAAEILGDFFNDNVELLPLLHREGQYWLLNFPKVLNCIDPERSAFTLFSDGGVKEYQKYSFREDVITNSGYQIFRVCPHDLPSISLGHTFVPDQFRDKVIQSELQGFRFVEVWDSSQQ